MCVCVGGGGGFPDVLIVWGTFAISIWDTFAVDMERYMSNAVSPFTSLPRDLHSAKLICFRMGNRLLCYM